MSGFSGINNFGSLTTASGQRLTFKDFDVNGDGKVTKEEYNKVLKEMDLDTVDLSTNDKNKDNILSEDEFATWEQKIAMQDAVNAMAGQIAQDFAGNASGLTSITSALKDYIETFSANYKGDVANKAEAFKEILPQQYETLKSNITSGSPDSIKSRVIEDMYNEIVGGSDSTRASEGANDIPDAAAKAIGKALDTEATKFVKSYKGNNLEVDLKAHLETFMNQSDADKLKAAGLTFKANAATFGNTIDSSELKQLKEYATEFLTAAVEAGVTIKLGNTNVKTTAAIKTALAKFTDGEELKSAVEAAIDGLSTTNKKQSIINANMTTADLTGENYKIDNTKIDFNVIDGYTDVNGNGTIYERGKGYSGSVDKAKDKARELLNQDALKNQYIQQITTMLESKGMKFDDIKTEFDNVWTQSIEDALNSDGMITGRGARGLSKKGKAYINIKDMVNKFDELFQANIKTAVDARVQANKNGDMYLGDLDLSAINIEDDSGTLTNARDLYFSGKTVTTRKRGNDYYQKLAEQMIDKLKDQMMTKAKAMCAKKGVTFDQSSFDKLFSSAKLQAVNVGLGKGQSATSRTGNIIGASGAAAVGGTVAAGVLGMTTLTTAGAGTVLCSTGLASGVFDTLAVTGAVGASVPVVGWCVAGASVVAAACLAIFGGGHHSSSSLNVQNLVNEFAGVFTESYTNWVDAEANKTKEKE